MVDLAVVVRTNAWVVYMPLVRAPLLVYSDASPLNWCWLVTDGSALLYVSYAQFQFPEHINVLELRALVLALSALCPRYPGRLWTFMCDNMVTVFQVNRMRGSCFRSNRLICQLASVLREHGSAVDVRWVPTAQQLADDWTRVPLDDFSHHALGDWVAVDHFMVTS